MPPKPSLLITGGSGYLGQRLVNQARANWNITATYLNNRPSIYGCEWLGLDICDANAVLALFERVTPKVVIHTAAVRGGANLERVNVDGTQNVAAAALRLGARLIHLSTDLVFDGQRGGYIESEPPSPINPYGRSKARAEIMLAELMPQAVVVRTSLIYGFDRPGHHALWMLETLRRGQRVTLFTDEYRNPVWVETLAAALLELAALDYGGVLHVTGSQVLNRYEFGCRMLLVHGAVLSGVIPVLAATLNSPRPLNSTLDISRAQKLLKTPLLGVDEAIARQQESRT